MSLTQTQKGVGALRLSELSHQYLSPIENKEWMELSPISIGCERCLPQKFFGPHIRNYYLIHFIISGTGIFKNPAGEYRVGEGQAFLIRPGESCIYTADKSDPWIYCWLGFKGRLASRFDSVSDVFGIEPWITDELLFAVDMKEGLEEYLAGILFKLLSSVSGKSAKQDRIKQVKDFINANFMQDITVGEIANMMNINRKYLTRVFRERTGVSVKQYLTEKRMSEAKRFLSEGFGVSETAAMVGYADSFNFSKAFKLQTGISPSEYRKNCRRL